MLEIPFEHLLLLKTKSVEKSVQNLLILALI